MEANKATTDVEPPQNESDHLGAPVATEMGDGECWEVYATDYPHVFVAHYTRENDEWVKQGLDRHKPSALFNADGWPTN